MLVRISFLFTSVQKEQREDVVAKSQSEHINDNTRLV